mgnify:CR=1 FL=1
MNMPAGPSSGIVHERQTVTKDDLVLNLTSSYDSLLNAYNIDNMFDYEKHCKSLFLKAIVTQNFPDQIKQ